MRDVPTMTVGVSGARIAYSRAGSGSPSLLFLHGALCERTDWSHQFEALRDDFTVVAIDQRCHGGSVADLTSFSVERLASDVHDVIDALRLAPIVVVGHSLGARVAIAAAAQRPANLAGIVLDECSRSVPGPSLALLKIVMAQRRRGNQEAFVRHAFESMFFANADPAVKARVLETALSRPMPEIRAITSATGSWDAFGLMPALRAIPKSLPALAIQGTFHDHAHERVTLGPTDSSTPFLDVLKRAMPQLEIVITPGTGHFNMLESPDLVTSSIRRFASAIRA